uniref:Cyanate_lyase domain-containing protein n=1 Tax=Syphacia muris TaxID=451379 RepID=A0A0N5AI22_9BILA
MSDARTIFTKQFKEEMKKKHLSYRGLAEALGRPVEWLVTVVVGNLALSESEAKTLWEKASFSPRDEKFISALTKLPEAALDGIRRSRDPVIYRLYEVLSLYGGVVRELLNEKVDETGFTLLKFFEEDGRVNTVWSAKLQPVNEPKHIPQQSEIRHGAFAGVKAKKLEKNLTWEAIAAGIGRSKEWLLAALLNRMLFHEDEAKKLCSLLDLDSEAYMKNLLAPPERGCSIYKHIYMPQNQAVDTYATAIKEMIMEDFGDGIMSAVNFEFRVDITDDDRIKMSWSGKFLPYKSY